MLRPIERVEIITGRERRRRYFTKEKVQLIEQTLQSRHDGLCRRPPPWRLA